MKSKGMSLVISKTNSIDQIYNELKNENSPQTNKIQHIIPDKKALSSATNNFQSIVKQLKKIVPESPKLLEIQEKFESFVESQKKEDLEQNELDKSIVSVKETLQSIKMKKKKVNSVAKSQIEALFNEIKSDALDPTTTKAQEEEKMNNSFVSIKEQLLRYKSKAAAREVDTTSDQYVQLQQLIEAPAPEMRPEPDVIQQKQNLTQPVPTSAAEVQTDTEKVIQNQIASSTKDDTKQIEQHLPAKHDEAQANVHTDLPPPLTIDISQPTRQTPKRPRPDTAEYTEQQQKQQLIIMNTNPFNQPHEEFNDISAIEKPNDICDEITQIFAHKRRIKRVKSKQNGDDESHEKFMQRLREEQLQREEMQKQIEQIQEEHKQKLKPITYSLKELTDPLCGWQEDQKAIDSIETHLEVVHEQAEQQNKAFQEKTVIAEKEAHRKLSNDVRSNRSKSVYIIGNIPEKHIDRSLSSRKTKPLKRTSSQPELDESYRKLVMKTKHELYEAKILKEDIYEMLGLDTQQNEIIKQSGEKQEQNQQILQQEFIEPNIAVLYEQSLQHQQRAAEINVKLNEKADQNRIRMIQQVLPKPKQSNTLKNVTDDIIEHIRSILIRFREEQNTELLDNSSEALEQSKASHYSDFESSITDVLDEIHEE